MNKLLTAYEKEITDYLESTYEQIANTDEGTRERDIAIANWKTALILKTKFKAIFAENGEE